MQTNRGEFHKKLEQSREELANLSRKIYDSKDVNAILAGIGTYTELFFKANLFPTESPWRPFKYFINCLDDLLKPEEVEDLQSFRRTYNLARHNPRFRIGVIEAQKQLNAVESVMTRVFELGVGNSGDPTSTGAKRVYWLSAWEHAIGDDIEVHIIVPGKSRTPMGPPELDLIRIRSDQWENAKNSLAAFGKLDHWKGHIPEEYVTTWKTLSDFIDTIAFEGEYRELLTCLAQFETLSDLIPGSQREDSGKNVLVACLVALVDVISAVPGPKGIVRGITKQVISTYALPESAENLSLIAEDLAGVARAVWDDVQPISGPLWASSDEFQKLKKNSIASSEKFPVIIDENRRLIALHS